ncbi:Beta-galactosidase [Cucumis melo var. makuwa]|uniref:Beta-galactosidase n=1 Tax=Cucumis melo var. makuwa TaxID=1194695 RepID=A0A5A7UKH6_CUCMM|nr:Beta-galactosidase [Cucumis melo var. makuwa]TYK03184.1 Beta-galactosidase [Cucumis melo var. makuwa]
MILEGHHKFGSLIEDIPRSTPGDPQERYQKEKDSLIRSNLFNGTTDGQALTVLSLIWQEMDLCREIVWNCPSDSIYYSRIEEVDKIHVFLASLNPRPYHAMSSLTNPTSDSTAFSVRSPNHDNEKHSGNQSLFLNTTRNSGISRSSVGNYMHRVSFPSQPYKSTQPFTLVHNDVWRPSKVTTSSGKRWSVTFIDNQTRLNWVFLISDKSEVTSTFWNFYHIIETQFNAKIAVLYNDNGRKFQNHTLNEILSSKGIVHQISCAYTPHQNGVAERKNRHLLEVFCSLMLSTSTSFNGVGENDESENNGSKTVVPKDMVEKGSVDVIITDREGKVDENEVIAESTENKTKQDHPGNIKPRKRTRLEIYAHSPKGHKTVECKWVFPLEYRVDGIFDRYNARRGSVYGPPPGFEAKFDNQRYNQGHSNHTVFTKVSKTGKIAMLIVYVNDIVLSEDDTVEIIQLKKKMGDEFEIKDLGNLMYFLEMEVARSKEGIIVSQRKYTLDLLAETGMTGLSSMPNSKMQFMQAPYENHMEAVNKVLRYLKATPAKGLRFRKTDWSKKQGVVARSSAEAKYRAMSLRICEEIWLQKVLSDLRQNYHMPIKLFHDNKAAISIANNPVQHDRTKQLEIDTLYQRETGQC